ncbi:hypothetical protein J6590_018590 [Homalodisca vitripennis]|nr:hypothetical protein J6590_018590 [Homalodisca vitripennis]
MYETRGRANYRTGRHRTVVYERLPSQACVHFLNKLPNSIKDAPTPKALRTRLKRFLVSQAFYNAGEFLAFDWGTAQLEDCLCCTQWVALAINERGLIRVLLSAHRCLRVEFVNQHSEIRAGKRGAGERGSANIPMSGPVRSRPNKVGGVQHVGTGPFRHSSPTRAPARTRGYRWIRALTLSSRSRCYLIPDLGVALRRAS